MGKGFKIVIFSGKVVVVFVGNMFGCVVNVIYSIDNLDFILNVDFFVFLVIIKKLLVGKLRFLICRNRVVIVGFGIV